MYHTSSVYLYTLRRMNVNVDYFAAKYIDVAKICFSDAYTDFV